MYYDVSNPTGVISVRCDKCHKPVEINWDTIELAKTEGVELNEEQLAAVSGGGCFKFRKCPECGSKYFETEPIEGPDVSMGFRCERCGHFWTES